MVRRGAGVYADGTKQLGGSGSFGGAAPPAIASANGLVTIGWTEAAFSSRGMIGPSCPDRSPTGRFTMCSQEETMAKTCTQCGTKAGFLAGLTFHNVHNRDMCANCAQKYIDNGTRDIVLTSTHSVDGYRITAYLGIESVEIVIGTGMFSEISTSIEDFFGTRSTAFEQKLATAKETAFKKLKLLAFEKGANAVVGVDLDYTEFSGNRIGLIVNGTLVVLGQ
jgi:uncharacterized protein YbjQ (UPF0145 family)